MLDKTKSFHFATLSAFIVFILSIAIFGLITGLKNDPKPKEIGEFEFEGTRTKVYLAGDCQIFATKWKNDENPRFFFSCDIKR